MTEQADSPTTTANLKWLVGARSETGYRRSDNQDRMSRMASAVGDVFIVSDGMGGHKGGALAAELTVKTLERRMVAAGRGADLAATMRGAFEAANAAVYDEAHSGHAETERMGATALMLVAADAAATIAHVGDSRAYLFRDGRLQRLTTDHTRVQRMLDAGMISAGEAEVHPDADMLERAMGHKATVEVDVAAPLRLRAGDRILLCSDGLCGYVADDEIAVALSRPALPVEVVDDLVALSLAKGGSDNVTVQLIQHGDFTMPVGPARTLALCLAIAVVASIATAAGLYRFVVTPRLDALSHRVGTLEDDRGRADAERRKIDGRDVVIPPLPPEPVKPVPVPETGVVPRKEPDAAVLPERALERSALPKAPGDAKKKPRAASPVGETR